MQMAIMFDTIARLIANVITPLIARFAHARAGMAAVEFAFILPVLVILFFGVVEGSDALSKSRKVSQAVNTLADLAAQETELLEADADDLFAGVEQIVGANGDTADIRLVSVITDGNGDIIVHWSRDNSGGQPYAPGAPYDDLPNPALLDPNASIIVGEIEFTHVTNLTHLVIPEIDFERLSTRWPRRASRVQLCVSPGDCTS